MTDNHAHADAMSLARLCLRLAIVAMIALTYLLLTGPSRAESALEWAIAEGARTHEAQIVTPLRPAAHARRERRRVELASMPMDIRTPTQFVALAEHYIGSHNPMRFRGPGCKAFVNMVARRAGFYVNASMRAFDTAGMGQRIAHPVPGAFGVQSRRGGGHVDIVVEVHGGMVTTINGNKGRNRVGWSYRPVAGAAYYLPIRG